jgi:hypothetical protein
MTTDIFKEKNYSLITIGLKKTKTVWRLSPVSCKIQVLNIIVKTNKSSFGIKRKYLLYFTI